MATETVLTHKRLLNIAVPIVLANITIPLLGLVDTGVVGQLGQAVPIGAVGIGAVILTTVIWIFGFLRMGTQGMTAQALGARDQGEVCALLVRALMIGLVVGGMLILVQMPLFAGAFWISPASPEVETLARDYLNIRIFGAPAAVALYGITGWMIAQERTRAVLFLQLWINGVNILLDLWFVLELGWSVEGVALATVIAQWTGLAIGLWMVRDGFHGGYWRDWAVVFDRVILRRMAMVSSDIMIRALLIQAAFVSFLFFGAGMGDVTLAANQILLLFVEISAYGLDGFAHAAGVLVGQAVGARDRVNLRRAVVMCSLWAGIIVVVMTLAFTLGGDVLIRLMTNAPDVQLETSRYLPWIALCPLFGVAGWMLDGVFVGATRTRDMRNMMFISTLTFFACVAVLLPIYGNHGLWVSMLVFFLVRGVTLAFRYPALERAVV